MYVKFGLYIYIYIVSIATIHQWVSVIPLPRNNNNNGKWSIKGNGKMLIHIWRGIYFFFFFFSFLLFFSSSSIYDFRSVTIEFNARRDPVQHIHTKCKWLNGWSVMMVVVVVRLYYTQKHINCYFVYTCIYVGIGMAYIYVHEPYEW